MNKTKLLYFFGFVIFLFLIFLNFLDLNIMNELLLIIGVIFSCSLIYIGGIISYKTKKDKGIFKKNIYIYFTFYMILLLFFLFVNPYYGRGDIAFQINLVPFKTLSSYIGQINSLYETKIIVNLVGNFICIMPFAFFSKQFFKKKYCILSIITFVFSIEIIQYITKTGSFDIDDIILNASGAILFYLLLKLNFLESFVKDFFYKEKNMNKNELKKLIILGLSLIIILISLILCRKRLFKINKEQYETTKRPELQFNYKNECSNDNIFYETDIYTYKFECIDASSFTVLINNEKEMTVDELINSTKYQVDIERILSVMDFEDIKYYKENRYDAFELKFYKYSDEYSIKKFVQNEFVKLIINEKEQTEHDYLLFDISIIPFKKGETTLKITITFDDNNETKNIDSFINIVIDENLNTQYQIIE